MIGMVGGCGVRSANSERIAGCSASMAGLWGHLDVDSGSEAVLLAHLVDELVDQ